MADAKQRDTTGVSGRETVTLEPLLPRIYDPHETQLIDSMATSVAISAAYGLSPQDDRNPS
jgi:hypothetical protein